MLKAEWWYMAHRKARLRTSLFETCVWCHIAARGIERRPLCRDHRDRERFCELVDQRVCQCHLALHAPAGAAAPPQRHTEVSIQGEVFLLNGRPTYLGRTYQGMKIEGLLMNARLVQATFDDLNPETRARWAYPDGPWNPERNTREFLAAMPVWRAWTRMCLST